MAKLSNLRHFLRDVVNMPGAEAGSLTGLIRKAGVNTDEQEAALLSHLREKYRQGFVGGDHFDDNLDDVLKNALGVRSFGVGTGLGERVYSAGNWHSKVKLKSHKEQVLQERQWDRELRKIKREEREAAAAAQERERFIAEKDRNLYDEKFAPETEKEFQERQQNVINQRHDDEVAGWNKLSEDNTKRVKAAARKQQQQYSESQALAERMSIADAKALEIEEKEAAAAKARKEQQLQNDFAKAQTDDYENLMSQEQPNLVQPVPDKTVTPINPPVEGSAAAKANVESSGVSQTTQDIYDNLRAMGESKQKAAEVARHNTAIEEGKQLQKQYEEAKANFTGSGKTIQESAATANPVETGPVDMTIDRAMLQQQMGGDVTAWGRKGAEKYALDRIVKKLESDREKIVQQRGLTPQQRASEWNKNKKEAADILKEGPDFRDYFFGNNLHVGAVGAAVITGTMGAAFGGHKSNSELYSSPF